MRKLFLGLGAFFSLLLVFAIAFFFYLNWAAEKTIHREENISPPGMMLLGKTSINQSQSQSQSKPIHSYPSSSAKEKVIKNKPMKQNPSKTHPTSVARENVTKNEPMKHSFSKTHHYLVAKEKITKNEPIQQNPGKTHPTTVARERVTKNEPTPQNPSNPVMRDVSAAANTKTSEAVLKYVLFSVSYDTNINAGETKSLQLKMSPKSELANLEKVQRDKKIQQSQISDIEKVQSQYKYVSAELIAKNHCLNIEKKMPEEDRVYLPSVNESSADQVWQWDLTAPEKPLTNICDLSLFIRFCLNQNDCIPSENPDKEFNVFIEITLVHRIYTWFTSIGNLASIGIPILTLIGLIGRWIWQRKQSQKKNQ